MGFVSEPVVSNYSMSLSPYVNEEYGILVTELPSRVRRYFSCRFAVTEQCLVLSSLIPHEGDWYSSPFEFQREKWYS